MKRLTLITLGVLLTALSMAKADDYAYRDGYWWFGGRAFTRQLYTKPGYWTYGCYGNTYTPGTSYYQYYEVPVAQAPYVAPPPAANDPGWRSKLADVVKSREEQRQYLEALQAVGHGDLAPAYGTGAGYGQAGYGFSYKFGANATTQYGVGPLAQDKAADIDRMFQAASQAVQNAQKYGGDGMSGLLGVVQSYGEQRNRVAETLAKAEILKALQDAPVNELRGFGVGGQSARSGAGTVASPVPPGVDAPQRGQSSPDLRAAFRRLAQDKCASCHSGASAKGGFDVAAYETLPDEGKLIVWQRLVTDDQSKMMPRDKTGGPGRRLTREEYDLFKAN